MLIFPLAAHAPRSMHLDTWTSPGIGQFLGTDKAGETAENEAGVGVG
jgi:hypothetical protein